MSKIGFEKTATNPLGLTPEPNKPKPPAGLTDPQAGALHWLRNRNGTGVFERNRTVLVAAGSRAPVMRMTWNTLRDLGLVTIEGSRVTVTPAGWACGPGLAVPHWAETKRY